MNFLTAVSQQMTRFTALIIVLASIIAFIEPATFSWVKGDTQVVVLGIIMLGMGMTLGKEDYQILAQRPLDIFIGAIAQYTIMPLPSSCDDAIVDDLFGRANRRNGRLGYVQIYAARYPVTCRYRLCRQYLAA